LKRLSGHKTSKILHFFDVFSALNLYYRVKNHKKTMVSTFRRGLIPQIFNSSTKMASIFGHIAASTALGVAFFPRQARPAVLLAGAICAAIPDADVLAFRFGISYDSIWGHRGWTHSLLFAGVFGALVAALFFHKSHDWRKITPFLMVATASHPFLDMLTNGGLGCALFFPFDNSRLFFPGRPIAVSPLHAGDFFSPWGLAVLASECVWIGLPCLLLVGLSRFTRFRD